MKKKVLIILLCVVVIILVLGIIIWGRLYNKKYIGGKSYINVYERDVSLAIIDSTLKNTGVTLVLNNYSDKLLRYDEEYKMEIKVDDEWHKINVSPFFNEPLLAIEANTMEDIEINWEDSYGQLEAGEYRILKKVYFEGDSDQRFYVSAEFIIE